MDTVADVKELTRKLVFTGHLNVPERRALPNRKVEASLIYSVLEEALQSGEWLHAWWLPDDSMIGCVIKYRGEGPTRVRWTYSGIEGERDHVREFLSHREAAQTLAREARPFWGNGIDGVPIDWDA
jgi:hypothetical protein